MPTYEYLCLECGHEFERFESMTAIPSRTCPRCNKNKAERRISAGGGFLFKGEGFYCTSHRKGSPKTDSEKESK